MLDVTDTEFEAIIAEAIDNIPEHYARHMDNVAVTWAEEPTSEQLEKLRIRGGTLFGLYEGIPRTKRTGNYSLVLPDKITIFKNPIVRICSTHEELKDQVAKTLWHEVAHHYGLDHDRIHELENNNPEG